MPEDGVPTWPSIAELEGSPGNTKIPASLMALIQKRYEEHAPEYVSNEMHHSGLPYNKCMFSDSLQECEEEVVDAVFNAMVYNMRAQLGATWKANGKLVDDLSEIWLFVQRIKAIQR